MTPFDPFVELTHLFSADGAHRSTPLLVLPRHVWHITDGEVYLEGGGKFVVREKAKEIHAKVIAKLEEGRQADVLGKT